MYKYSYKYYLCNREKIPSLQSHLCLIEREQLNETEKQTIMYPRTYFLFTIRLKIVLFAAITFKATTNAYRVARISSKRQQVRRVVGGTSTSTGTMLSRLQAVTNNEMKHLRWNRIFSNGLLNSLFLKLSHILDEDLPTIDNSQQLLINEQNSKQHNNSDRRRYQVEIGSCNLPGSDPDRPHKVNQDSHFYFRSGNIVVLGALDGHGLKGHIVSNYLANEALPNRIQQLLMLRELNSDQQSMENHNVHNGEFDDLDCLLEQIKQKLLQVGNADPNELINPIPSQDTFGVMLRDAFLLAQYDCIQNQSIPSQRSGSTCVVCMIDTISGVIEIATVGDSRAILLQVQKCNDQNTDTIVTTENRNVTVYQLTENTSVKIASERSRIDSCPESRIDSSGNVFYGPVGIAMTRALGDAVMLRAGVLPIPFTSRLIIPRVSESTWYLCLATDGVFDVVTNKQISDIVQSRSTCGASLNEIALDVSIFANNSWLDDLPIETKVDDITFLIAKIFSL